MPSGPTSLWWTGTPSVPPVAQSCVQPDLVYLPSFSLKLCPLVLLQQTLQSVCPFYPVACLQILKGATSSSSIWCPVWVRQALQKKFSHLTLGSFNTVCSTAQALEGKNGSNWFLREEAGVNSSNRNFRVACLKNTASLILQINRKVLQKKQYRLYRAVCLVCKQTSCLFGQAHVLPNGVRGGEELLTSELHGWHTAEESGAAPHCRSHS